MKKYILVLASFLLLSSGLGMAQLPGKVPDRFGQTYSDRSYIRMGTSEDTYLGYDTTQTNDALVFGLSTDSETALFMQKGDVGTDVGLSDLNIPNIAIVGTDVSDWVRIYHDGTNPVIRSSGGTLIVTNGIETAITGNSDTATALAANPTDCAANTFATTIAASGNLTCAAVGDAGVTDALTISGGTINSSVIGGITPAAATVTTLSVTTSIDLLTLTQADLTSTCTTGQARIDTGGGTIEFCYCRATDTWACTALASGPTD